jgi:outer membrane protein assembly factor BamB
MSRPHLLSIVIVACSLIGATIFPALPFAGAASVRTLHVTAKHLWTASISPNADSAPAYLANVPLSGGRRQAVVYVLAGNNTSNCSPGDPVHSATTYAFIASTGKLLWKQSTSGAGRCTTSGPAVDPKTNTVYVAGLDGKIHRYAESTGHETTRGGWPVSVTRLPDVEKISAPLTFRSPYLYATTSGFIGDQGHYDGHLVTINVRTGHAAVFNSLCSNIRALPAPNSSDPDYCSFEQSGLFGRGQGAIDPVTHDVYIVSGNGPWNGKTNWGDSIMKLDPSGSKLLDTYTPADQSYLNENDLDLGSTGPAMFPTITQGGKKYHLLAQGGKGGECSSCRAAAVRLLNRDDLSGKGGPGNLGGDLQDIAAPGGCEVLTAPAIWSTKAHGAWLILANSCGVTAYRLTSPSTGKFKLVVAWSLGQGGSTPVVKQGVLWIARDGNLGAYNPLNGQTLWSTDAIGGIHWEYPLVAGNRLFLSDELGHLQAFSVKM